MNCPNCGAPLKEGAKFCTQCGTKIQVNNSQPQSADDKGFIDNITHLGTFIQRGSRGVQREIRNEERDRIQREAEAAGLEVRKPQRGGQSDTEPERPRERRLFVSQHTFGAPGDDTIEVVSGRAIWNINTGEIARRITEREFANVEGLKGVIVQEGCSALVYIDGQLVSLMQSGCYTFPAKTQTEIKLEQRQKEIDAEKDELKKLKKQQEDEQRKEAAEHARTFASRGIFGEVASFGRGVMNFLFGKKKDEKPEVHKARIERTEKKLRALPSPKICRVYIVSNRIIDLIFGYVEVDGAKEFAPMVIPSRLVDIEVAVSMQLQISNMTEFVTNYLADKNTLSVRDIQNELSVGVKAILTQLLRNLDYQQEGLPEPVVANLKNRLKMSCNERLHGIEVVNVLDITDSSADFERFRQVERELFASEKELGYLQRTNEFRNRLEQEQNKPVINSARNAEDLRQALQAINKDKLLSEDEMEQFVMLLESQKRLREATTKEEEYEALMDLKKNHLVKDDDVAALENTLAQGVITRENVTEIMRIQATQEADMARQIAEFELSDNKREHDMADALRQARHQGELASVQLDTKRLVDAYDDERNEFDWNRAFNRQQQERLAANQQASFEQDLAEKKIQADWEREQKEKELAHQHEMDEIAQQNEALKAMLGHETDIHKIDADTERSRYDTFVKLDDAEKIKAAQLDRLDKDAQVAMANAYGSEKENEYLRKQAEKDEAHQAEEMDRMERILDKMQNGMLGMAGVQMANQQQQYQQQQAYQQQRYDDQVALKQEYRQQAQQAQARQDNVTGQALDSMGNFAGAAAGNIGAFNGGLNGVPPQTVTPQAPVARRCPTCGAEIAEGEQWCPECGQKLG